jgi:hypothetical protein
MGMRLRLEVERQLLEDLRHYIGASDNLRIDWSNPCQEGHCTTCLDGDLESLSDISVRNLDGVIVAEGWMDFIHGGGDEPLFVFWLFLDLVNGDEKRDVKPDRWIPEHVWDRLTDETRSSLHRTERHGRCWSADPRVLAWKQSHPD